LSKEDNIILNLKNLFNIAYKKKKTEFHRNIFRKIFGNDYPEEVDPESFVTLTDLQNIVRYLNVGSGETFIDVGCGRGAPGNVDSA